LQHGFQMRYGDESGCSGCRRRHQFEDGGGDDAEGAFRTDEQLLQIVAGVVLLERAQAVPYAAIREYGLKPQYELAGRAIGKNSDATSIGRQIAADGAGAFGRQTEWKQPADRGRLCLDFRQRDPGLNRDMTGVRADVADLAQTSRGQNNFSPVL